MVGLVAMAAKSAVRPQGLRPTQQLLQFVHPALPPTVFTELSPIKPEDSPISLLEAILYSTPLVKKIINYLALLLFADLLFLDNGYALAFRLTAGIGHNSFEKYTAVGRNDDADGLTLAGVPCGCLTVNGSLPCDRHFRSRLLDAWPASLIDRVR